MILPPSPPAPNEKLYPVGERLKTRFFYRLEKIVQPPPTPPPQITSLKRSPVQSSPVQSLVQSSPESSPVQSSPVQSRVQSRFSNWQSTQPAFKKAVRQLRFQLILCNIYVLFSNWAFYWKQLCHVILGFILYIRFWIPLFSFSIILFICFVFFVFFPRLISIFLARALTKLIKPEIK